MDRDTGQSFERLEPPARRGRGIVVAVAAVALFGIALATGVLEVDLDGSSGPPDATPTPTPSPRAASAASRNPQSLEQAFPSIAAQSPACQRLSRPPVSGMSVVLECDVTTPGPGFVLLQYTQWVDNSAGLDHLDEVYGRRANASIDADGRSLRRTWRTLRADDAGVYTFATAILGGPYTLVITSDTQRGVDRGLQAVQRDLR